MTAGETRRLTINVDGAQRVSGLLQTPRNARACYVFAHGAGAGMTHPFMEYIAAGLAKRDVATLRYQFPYVERGSRRPDSSAVAEATVRAAVAHASRMLPNFPLLAGGKSFGGRMTSQAQAQSPLPGVRGIAFFGFPLHRAGQPSDTRAKHLFDVRIPILFMQGARDKLADLRVLQPLVAQLGTLATLKILPDADHSFHVPARTGRTDDDVRPEMLDTFTGWIYALIS